MIIDDTLLAEDDDDWDEDDIGEYDEQPASVHSKPTLRHTTATPLTAPASLSAATAISSFTAVRQSHVTAKKKRGGWDDVDIGELTIHQMDEQIELERKQQEAQRLAVERSRQWNTFSHQDAVNAQYQAQLQRHPSPIQPRVQHSGPSFSARGRSSFGRGGPRAGVPIVPATNVRLAGQHAGLGLSAEYAGGRRIDGTARATGDANVGKKRKAGELMVGQRPHPHHYRHCMPIMATATLIVHVHVVLPCSISSLVSCFSTCTARSLRSVAAMIASTAVE